MTGPDFRRLWWRWFTTVTVGEFFGFAIPAVAGAATAGVVPGVAVPVMLAAGAAEGTLLGLAQAHVLRGALPAINGRRWVGVTAAAAGFAYAIGMVPSVAAGLVSTWPAPIVVAGGVVLGLLLASIGTAQWPVLRTVAGRSARWILTTGAAWVVGIAVFCGFTMPLWHPGQPVAAAAGIGIAGGLLMAATTSAITGEALRRLLIRMRDRPAPDRRMPGRPAPDQRSTPHTFRHTGAAKGVPVARNGGAGQ